MASSTTIPVIGPLATSYKPGFVASCFSRCRVDFSQKGSPQKLHTAPSRSAERRPIEILGKIGSSHAFEWTTRDAVDYVLITDDNQLALCGFSVGARGDFDDAGRRRAARTSTAR